jgi:hypothetical protein
MTVNTWFFGAAIPLSVRARVIARDTLAIASERGDPGNPGDPRSSIRSDG